MKSWTIVIILLLALALVSATSCSLANAKEQDVDNQLAEENERIVTVSGSGNIEVTNELKLTFGVAGKVDEVYVEEGDEVNEGDVLAKLETDALELALTEAQVAQREAQLAVTKAQIALQTAEYNLEEAKDLYTLADIKVAQANVDQAGRNLEEALWIWSKYDPGTPGWEEYQKIVLYFQARLDTAEDKLDAMLSGFDTEEVEIKKLHVEEAKQSLELIQHSVELAQQSLELAQKQLDEATITAPFDGAVALVGVDEGDTVTTAMTIVHLIDLNSMELNIEVDEIDMPEVKLGQKATIEIDALPALELEGKVSSISLLPKIETGLIVYDVKIEFDVPEGIGLRTGMSAAADIIISE